MKQDLSGEGLLSLKLLAAWISVIGLTILIYQSGVSDDFFFDDRPNIAQNANVHLTEFDVDSVSRAIFSGSSGPLGRPVAMFSFSINHYFTGLSPAAFKLTNIVIHLLVGLALAVLASQLINQLRRTGFGVSPEKGRWIVLLATAVWLLHPINLSSVLYIVQRMNSLSALFTILAMVGYMRGRVLLDQRRMMLGWVTIIASIIFFGMLGVLSKENGALLPLYLLCIEWTLFQFQKTGSPRPLAVSLFFAILIGLPTLFSIYYLFSHPEILSYEFREFSLLDRLLTQFRILISYLQLLLIPDISQMGIFLDDIIPSKSLIHPVTTLLSMIAIIALLLTAVLARKKHPIVSLGLLWFFCGHALESTIFPLELAYEHRNYLPGFGVVFIVVFYLIGATPSWLKNAQLKYVLLGLWFGLISGALFLRAQSWSDWTSHVSAEVIHHPNSPRSQYTMGTVYATLADLNNDRAAEFRAQATEHYDNAQRLRPSMAGAIMAQFYPFILIGRQIPKALLDRAVKSLQDYPIDSQSVTSLGALTRCLTREKCTLLESSYLQLINAALANKIVSQHYLAMLFQHKASYYESVKLDSLTSASLMEQAGNNDPNDANIALRLAALRIKNKQWQDARELLAELSKSSWKPHLTNEIRKRQLNIEALEIAHRKM